MLSASDREFLAKVARAALANPFGEEREQVDRQLAGHGEPDEIVARVLTRVEKKLATCLDAAGRIPERTPAADAELLSHAVFFDAFHRHFGAMDAHITAQLAAGVTPIHAGFAPPLFNLCSCAALPEIDANVWSVSCFRWREDTFSSRAVCSDKALRCGVFVRHFGTPS